MFRPTPRLLLLVLLSCLATAASAAQVGLFMGSFDPPHYGILRMIEEARTRLSLDAIHVVPAPVPVDRAELAPVEHRLAMLRLLTRGVPEVVVPTAEELQALLDRHPANLFAAIRDEIMSKRPPEDEIFQIIGEDALPKLLARDQLPVGNERRRVVVFPRHGVAETQDPALANQIRDGRVIRFDADIPDLASRDLRQQMLERCEPTADALPETIRGYISREGLYGMPATPLSSKLLEHFSPVGYLARAFLLKERKTDPVFEPLSLENIPASVAGAESAALPESDFPAALSLILENHQVRVTLLRGAAAEALDWLKKEGWSGFYGYVPVRSESDDRPTLLFGRRGGVWHLFMIGIVDSERFSRLAADVRKEFSRLEIAPDRLALLAAQP